MRDAPAKVHITPAQVRAARGLLRWTQHDLGRACGIAHSTLSMFEVEQRWPHASTLRKLRTTLEAAGVIFLETEEGSGLLLPNKARRKKAID